MPPVITSKSRFLFLRFYTDQTVEATGFTLTFAYVDEGTSCPSKYQTLLLPVTKISRMDFPIIIIWVGPLSFKDLFPCLLRGIT